MVEGHRKEGQVMDTLQITLRAARVNSGLTRKEAAKRFGVSSETLANYELNSERVPHLFYSKVQSVYGISPKYVFFGKEADFLKEISKLSVV